MKKILINKRQPWRNLFVLVNDEDYERVSALSWSLYTGNTGIRYAKHTYPDNSSIYIHRFILNAPSNLIIDHKNKDGLDNRRSNLRFCSYSENSMNTRKPFDNTSGYKGVYWNKAKKLWQSQIVVDGACIYLGRYKTAEEGNKARLEAEGRYFPNLL